MADFVDEYSPSQVLRSDGSNGRYLRSDYGSMNASSNGHPSVSGAVDQKLLCLYRKNQEEPCNPPHTPKEAYRAVLREQLVSGQINNSFRSVERNTLQRVGRTRSMQMARCSRLLESNNR